MLLKFITPPMRRPATMLVLLDHERQTTVPCWSRSASRPFLCAPGAPRPPPLGTVPPPPLGRGFPVFVSRAGLKNHGGGVRRPPRPFFGGAAAARPFPLPPRFP